MKLAQIYEGSVANLAGKLGNNYFSQPGLQKVPVKAFGDPGTGPQSGDEISTATTPLKGRHRKFMRSKASKPIDHEEI